MRLSGLRGILLTLGCCLLAAGAALASQQESLAGRKDLSEWDFGHSIATLDGRWQFVPGSLLEPGASWPADAVGLEVPGSWNSVMGGSHGQGTYRLRVDCSTAEPLMLAMPIQHSAMRLYVNGQLVARQGKPGALGAGHQPDILRQHVPLPAQSCPLDLVAQVSNYEWFRGGLVRSIQLGSPSKLAQRREDGLTRSVLALGATLMVALFSLSFQFAYSAGRRDRTPLYFGLFCMSCAIALGLSAERPFQPYLGWLGFEGQMRLLFANWSLGLAMFPFFLGSLYPREAGRLALRLIAGFSGAATLAALLAPVGRFAMLAPALQVVGAAVAIYAAAVLMRALLNRRFAAAVLLVGLAVLVAAVVHDVMHFQHVLAVTMLPYGMLGFVVAPAALLALRLARALSAEELRTLEQRGRSDMLVRATKAGVLDWDATTGVVTPSDRYREMLGYPAGADAPEPPPFRQLLHPDEHDKVHGSFMRQLRDRSGSGVHAGEAMDFRLRRADGEYIWVHAEAISLRGSDGRTLRYICTFIDISERKRHEQELASRAKFINDLFDSVPLGLALRDPRGCYLIVNRTWELYNGLSRESVIGASLEGVDDPAARAALALDQQALQLGPGTQMPPHEFDYNGRRFMQTRTVMADAEGKSIGVLAASLDITEKHQTEQALATERERLRLLVRSTRAGFGDWDAVRDRVTYSNRFKEMLDWPHDTDTSSWPSIFEMMHPDDRERAREEFRQMIRRKARSGEQEPGEPMSYRLRRRDGSYIWIHAEGISQVDEQGRTRRFITSYLDVTAFREQEEALRASHDQIVAQAALLEKQNEALKENVRLREEVERIGRHDIKTPLNSIVAVPRLLREERRLGPEADELLGIVERAGYRILSMVNLSLDLHKMEQGGYVFRPDAVDLHDLVGKVLADVRMHASSKQVRLEVNLGQIPYAWAEELLCYSLLANLLKNAVEASPEGAVVAVKGEVDGADNVVLHIHNRGVVPASIRSHFFQKYATLGKASGTGLGTYSARLMAKVQDGDITMETSEAQGTTLSVTLRAAPAGAVPATLRHAAERRGVEPALISSMPPTRVLLVDDDEYNLMIVRRFLPTPPFTVDTAINGRVALSAAQLQWPDVIFMDLDMPVMGGLQAVQELRAMERARLAKPCTMVALSSHEDEETRRRALAAGFDQYLTKPVTRDIIHETLLELDQLIGDGPNPSLVQVPIKTASRAAGMHDPVVCDPDVEPVLAEFMASRKQLIQAMSGAMQAGDRPEVRRIAHQLAGSFGLYGFAWASDQSRWIEKNFIDVEPDRLEQLAGALREHLEKADIRWST